MVLNSKINVLTPETVPFSVGITTLEAFLGLNRGGGGMLDLEFLKKNFKKLFAPKLKLVTFPLFFSYFGSYGGLGRVET